MEEEMVSKISGEKYILELNNISKTFPGVKALDKVNFNLNPGEVHALVGENGAGKSTMIKIIAGVYSRHNEGMILINGLPVQFNSPSDAIAKGIKVVYQELNLIPGLSVAENVFLGNFSSKRLGIINWKIIWVETNKILNRLGLDIDPKTEVSKLRIAEQQIVEIAHSLSHGAKIIIMDEPTSALSPSECKNLFEIIHSLKKEGISIIYVTHKLEEVYQIANRVTVLRDGKNIITKNINEITVGELIYHMIGREIIDLFPKTDKKIGNTVLSVKELSGLNLKNINLDVRAGEIVGIFGLLGSGKEGLARLLFGLEYVNSGEIYIDGKLIKINSPTSATNNGIGLLTENRREEGIIQLLSVQKNMTIASLEIFSKVGWLLQLKESRVSKSFIKKLDIKTSSLSTLIRDISGGNQQKVLLARWMIKNQRVLIVVEPTRGIDVGSKVEIHKLIDNMARQGVAIIIVSSEFDEIIGLSDKIIVMHEGCITGEFTQKEVTKKKLMMAAIGGKE